MKHIDINNLRLVITSQFSAQMAGKNVIKEDVNYVQLNLQKNSHDQWHNSVATSVVNFPTIDGQSVVFIHNIVITDDEFDADEVEKLMIDIITTAAKEHSYQNIYINLGKQNIKRKTLKSYGFKDTSSGIGMMCKNLNKDEQQAAGQLKIS